MTRKAEPEQALATVETGMPAPVTMYEIFARLTSDPTVDPAKLKQFMELQERAEKRQAEKEFIAAFARLKFPPIAKSSKGHNSKYAAFDDIQAVIDPILAAEGFTLTYSSGEITPQGIPIHGLLSHVAGHSRPGVVYLPRDKSGSMNEIQGSGSTFSYGQRYVAKMMLNLRFIGDDDDASGSDFIDERQVNNIIDLMAACEMGPDSESKFLQFMNAERVSEIHKRDYAKAMQALQQKHRKRMEAL